VRVKGRLPGDERMRIERIKPQEFVATPLPQRRRPVPAALVLVIGFATLIAIGTALLALPIATASGQSAPLLDALFTATSAVCVTGLIVVDTGTYWSGFGQLIILLLVQIGGFGFMTSSTLLLLLVVRRRTRLRDRVLVQETLGTAELGNVTDLVKRVAIFTIVAEVVGAILLTTAFLGDAAPGPHPLWFGVFHSISAFNNAGFDLMGAVGQQSMLGLRTDYLVLGVLGVLITLGALGYAIVEDVIRHRRFRSLALESKIVLLTTVALIVGGAVAISIFEWDKPQTLGALQPAERVLNALFESVSLRTAGFSAFDTSALAQATVFVVMGLMFVGGASGSTAGGIKVNTFSVLLIAIVSTARGLPSAEAFGRRIEHLIVYRALAVALLSIAFLFVISLGLALTTEDGFLDVLFEAVSAFGTVGTSRGITAALSDAAHFVLIAAMFVGRLGPLALVIGLTARRRSVAYRHAVESVRIG
jgi:trk system potassium uptake protein TrkH